MEVLASFLQKSYCQAAAAMLLFISISFVWSHPSSADQTYSVEELCNPTYSWIPDNIGRCVEVAEAGDATASWMLGLRYHSGWGVGKNIDLAMMWWERAAEQGFAYAQHDLAKLYLTHYWSVSAERVIELFTAAADNPNANDRIAGQAAGYLGRIFWFGFHPIERQPALAAEWIERGIQLNDVQSHYLLGELYLTGTTVPQSYREARHWWSIAAERGSIDAQHALGKSFKNEEHGALNLERSVYWLSRAAQNGDVWAQRDLSGMYQLGRGLETDMELAHMWMNIAAATSGDDFRELFELSRDEIAANMSSEQVLRAQAMAVNCMRSGFVHPDCKISTAPQR